ncbi:GTPase IMAP family member 7-like [Eleginops maclovinus]|uniref:GTPase IMAP family member 7-like n=1 Tax=Eleginops maclovinus TaxID=56733 RepID=UPI0030807AB2
MDVQTSRRIVLLGKTGAGKSSLANTMSEDEVFMINHCPVTEVPPSYSATKFVNGRSLSFIDTPGFFDTHGSVKSLKADIVRCITECAPGPHAFLIVLKVEKFTEQEKEVINEVCTHFSEAAFKYATCVFTHGDQLQKGMTIEEFVGQNVDLSDLVKKCGGRCHVVDNKYWKNSEGDVYRCNQFQVERLLNTLDQMIEANNGSFYTNEMLETVKTNVQQEAEQIRQSSANVSQEEIIKQAKSKVFDRILILSAGIATGVLLGAFLGLADMVTTAVATLKNPSDVSSLAATSKLDVAFAALKGMVNGFWRGFEAGEGSETTGEAINKTVQALKK